MVLGLFSKERALKKNIEKATKKLAQHVDRLAAMEKLNADGSEEAIYGLLKRFSFTSDKGVEDEQEKRWVVDILGAKGEAVLPALRRYLLDAASIAYPLEILGRVADHDTTLDIVDKLTEREEPGYSRDPTKKMQLIDWLAEWSAGSNEEIASRIAPYLADFDEGVRFAAVEALERHIHPCAAEPLLAALTKSDEESGRLKQRIADVVAAGEFPVGDHKEAISELLKRELDGFQMKHDKLRPR